MPVHVLYAVIAALFGLILLVPFWCSLERVCGIDQQRVASALRWSVRVLTRPASLVVIAIGMALLILPSIDDRLWFLAIPAMLFILSLPFGIFTTGVASSETGNRWWIPRWPGVRPFLAVSLLLALVAVVDGGAAILSQRVPSLTPLTIAITIILEILTLALTASILLFRDAKSIWSWRRLGPVAAVHARVAFGLLVLLAPIAIGAWIVWKVIPAQASWAEEHGTVIPWWSRALVTIADVLGTSGVFVASLTIGAMLMLMISRVLWETRHP